MRINRRSFTIPSNNSLSDVQKLNDAEVIAGVEMPSVWTSALLSFNVGTIPNNLFPYYRNSAEVTISALASTFQEFDAVGYMAAAKYIQLRSGTNATPVLQSGARTITLITIELG